MLTFRRIRVVASFWGGWRAYCAYHITISLSSRYFPFLPSPWLLNQGKYLAHEQFKPYHRAVARHMRGWEKFDNHRHWSRLMGQSYKIKIGRKERSAVLTKMECLCQEVSDLVGAAQVKAGLSTSPKGFV